MSGILLVKGKAGLGNRILSLLTASLYAKLSGRELLVDWSDPVYSDDGRNVFADLFGDSAPSGPIPVDDSVAPALWRGRLGDPARNLVRDHPDLAPRLAAPWAPFAIDLRRLDHPERIAVYWSYTEEVHLLRRHFPGRMEAFRGLATRTILSRTLRRMLRPAPAVRDRVDTCWSGGPERTVGVHVRFTDKRTRLAMVRRRLERLLRSKPGLSILLATDSLDVEALFREAYAGVWTLPKWLPPGGRSLHHRAGMPGRLAHGIDALCDLYSLARCRHLIVDGSSAFSTVATLIADLPPERVIDVAAGRHLPETVRRWLGRLRR